MAAAKKKSKARAALDSMFADQTADLPDPSYRGKEKRLGIVVDIIRKQDTASEKKQQSKTDGQLLVADGLPPVTDDRRLVADPKILVTDRRIPVADGQPLVDEPVADPKPPVAESRPLVADGLSPVKPSNLVDKAIQKYEQDWVPLSPLQWQVWEALLLADTEQRVVSYKEISVIAKASIQGVRKVFGVLEKEGGILKRQTIRERTVQGLKVTIDRARPFRQVTLRDTQALIRRESITSSRPSVTSSRQSATATSDRPPRMYVCKKNTYIREEDLTAFLRLPPQKWAIREQTLVQIADAFPDMTALEFRMSLRRLIEQADTGKQSIQNPNAWLRAAFEKNGGPLVTEREIEARLGQHDAPKLQQPTVQKEKAEEDHDLVILRLYVTATPEERAQIDAMAEKRVAPILASFSADKHAGIHEQAKIECTRELFKVEG